MVNSTEAAGLSAGLKRKLHPARYPNASGRMVALVNCILGHPWEWDVVTEPDLVQLVVTSDNFVLARAEGDCGHNHFIGDVEDLRRNWLELLKAAGLTPEEFAEAEAYYTRQVCSAAVPCKS